MKRYVVAITAVLVAAPAAHAAPGDGRVYEQVTPQFKNAAGFGAIGGTADTGLVQPQGRIALDGNRVVATAQAAFADPNTQCGTSTYRFQRGPSGWSAAQLNPALPDEEESDFCNGANLTLEDGYAASDDLSRMTFLSNWRLEPVRDRDAGGVTGNMDAYGLDPDGGFELASCPAAPAPACDADASLFPGLAGTPDGRAFVFETAETLMGADGQPLFPDATGQQVYVRSGDEIEWVSRPLDAPLPDGATQVASTPSTLNSNANSLIGPSTGPNQQPHPISDDGSRIFFLSPVQTASKARLYARIDGNRTLEVSRVRGGTGPVTGVLPRGASADGNVAFFATTQALFPESGSAPQSELDPNGLTVDLYAWKYDPETGTDSLTRVAGLPQVGGGPPANNPGPGAGTPPADQRFDSLLGASEDGTRVYFTTRSPTFSSASPGSVNLYVAEQPADAAHGTVRFIATVYTGTAYSATSPPSCLNTSIAVDTCARVTPDGRRLAFQSRLPLTPDDRDTDGATTCAHVQPGAIPQVCKADTYLYDAGTDGIARVSIGADGPTGSRGNASDGTSAATCTRDDSCAFDAFTVNGRQANDLIKSGMTADGSSVFIQTIEQLVPEDVNDTLDVYEFARGRVQLISDGSGPGNSLFVGNTPDGRDVFFITADDLVPADSDGAADIYDARVGGGFPLLPSNPCDPLSDRCQGTPAPPVTRPPVASGTPGGADLQQGPRAQLTVLRPSAKAKRRAARTGVLHVRVRTTVPGIVSGLARSRVRAKGGLRTRTVGRDRVPATRPGTVTMVMPLSDSARRRLRARRSLRVSVQAGLTGARRRSRTVVLKQPGKPSSRRAN